MGVVVYHNAIGKIRDKDKFIIGSRSNAPKEIIAPAIVREQVEAVVLRVEYPNLRDIERGEENLTELSESRTTKLVVNILIILDLDE